ncbi:hypothetical protein GCM10010112_14650 [Actinoplanes lobatus]|uniref:Uncharacterized protein n=1 Tax=Actinoplanes lobatus TaxID=113568 RepID=A0ABQ4AAE5_9ACTN|nr:hypothetical protein GCM10010112_14650 [Actinoplanes lobatus]GIE37831.1 hypothetical protein Alo02nite_07290 [Actinoplanes lobatus]
MPEPLPAIRFDGDIDCSHVSIPSRRAPLWRIAGNGLSESDGPIQWPGRQRGGSGPNSRTRTGEAGEPRSGDGGATLFAAARQPFGSPNLEPEFEAGHPIVNDTGPAPLLTRRTAARVPYRGWFAIRHTGGDRGLAWTVRR